MDSQAKQQIVERIKQAENILITVSKNPSVDQLASLIGLTLLLNKMGKSATAVFSGKVPSTIEFLQPEKTIETNTDSLRDFIISLDKSKADKLRYKVEDEVVRIFITPYRTSIGQKDLVFSQGDFNVQVVVALGIKDQAQIDEAITAHGKILHDATVIALNSGQARGGNIGQINWQEPSASSLSEMLVSISEAFGPNLIDNQIATAFLTGIVAETERFSNAKTSPKVMTMSAQMMAAGANQQLIVSKLEPPPPPPPPPPKPAFKPVEPPKPPEHKKPAKKPEETLKVSHEKAKPDGSEVKIGPNEIRIDEEGNLKTAQELKSEKEKREKERLEKILASAAPPPPPPEPSPAKQIEPEPPVAPPPPPPPLPPKTDTPPPNPHSFMDPTDSKPPMSAPFTADTQTSWGESTGPQTVDPLNIAPPTEKGTFDHEKRVAPPEVDNARSAVKNALSSSNSITLPPVDSGSPDTYVHPAPPPPPPSAPPPPFPPPPPGLANPLNGNNHSFPLPPNPA
jgi:hypothetical protein